METEEIDPTQINKNVIDGRGLPEALKIGGKILVTHSLKLTESELKAYLDNNTSFTQRLICNLLTKNLKTGEYLIKIYLHKRKIQRIGLLQWKLWLLRRLIFNRFRK